MHSHKYIMGDFHVRDNQMLLEVYIGKSGVTNFRFERHGIH